MAVLAGLVARELGVAPLPEVGSARLARAAEDGRDRTQMPWAIEEHISFRYRALFSMDSGRPKYSMCEMACRGFPTVTVVCSNGEIDGRLFRSFLYSLYVGLSSRIDISTRR